MKYKQALVLVLLSVAGMSAMADARILERADGKSGGGPVILGDQGQAQGTHRYSRRGSFDGFDAQQGAVWIGDHLYWMHPELRVVGSATKLGLLSAIRRGETVEFTTQPDPEHSGRQLIVEIRRQ